jgi:hypothetical protein
VQNFFHKIGILWTLGLTTESTQIVFEGNVEFAHYTSWIDGADYVYPERDFCLFAPWPQHLLIIPGPNNVALLKCTSTLRWLLQIYLTSDRSSVFASYPFLEQVVLVCKNDAAEWTRILTDDPGFFNKKVNLCNITNTAADTTLHAEYYQVQFVFEFVQDLVTFIAIPCACFSGFVLNYLVVWTVNKNKEKDLKDAFYQVVNFIHNFLPKL